MLECCGVTRLEFHRLIKIQDCMIRVMQFEIDETATEIAFRLFRLALDGLVELGQHRA
jgi:hypothetical protein